MRFLWICETASVPPLKLLASEFRLWRSNLIAMGTRTGHQRLRITRALSSISEFEVRKQCDGPLADHDRPESAMQLKVSAGVDFGKLGKDGKLQGTSLRGTDR